MDDGDRQLKGIGWVEERDMKLHYNGARENCELT